jgi:hypothetical protein
MAQRGALVSDLDSAEDARLELEPEILAAISAGRKLEAIKLLREEYGMGLVEAKGIADELMVARDAVGASTVPQPLQMDPGPGHLIAKSLAGEKNAASTRQVMGSVPQSMQMETGVGRLIGIVLVAALVAASYWMLG